MQVSDRGGRDEGGKERGMNLEIPSDCVIKVPLRGSQHNREYPRLRPFQNS